MRKSADIYYKLCNLAYNYRKTEVLDYMIIGSLKHIKFGRNIGLQKMTVKLPLKDQIEAIRFSLPENDAQMDLTSNHPAICKKRGDLVVRLLGNYRVQASLILIFRILHEFIDNVHDGWCYVSDVVHYLHFLHLLPDSLSKGSDGPIPRVEFIKKKENKNKNRDSSIFSALSSFLLSGERDEDEESLDYQSPEAELNAYKVCRDFVQQFDLERLFLERTKDLDDPSLESCTSFILFTSPLSSSVKNLPPTYVDDCIFAIDLSFRIMLNNPHKLNLFWPIVRPYCIEQLIVQAGTWHITLVRRAVVCLCVLVESLLAFGLTSDPAALNVFNDFSAIESLFDASVAKDHFHTGLQPNALYFPRIALSLIISIQRFVDIISRLRKETNVLVETRLWMTIVKTVKVCATIEGSSPKAAKSTTNAQICEAAWSTLISIHEKTLKTQILPLSPSSFADVVDMICAFLAAAAQPVKDQVISASVVAAKLAQATSGVPMREHIKDPTSPDSSHYIKRALESLRLLHELHPLCSRLAQGSEDGWKAYWMPLLDAISQQCYHPNKEIRQDAVTCLQRTLLSKGIEQFDVSIFNNVLFPLLDTLLQPEMNELDQHTSQLSPRAASSRSPAASVDEVRIRVSTLLCKIFLHYFIRLNERLSRQDLNALWVQILVILEKYYISCTPEGSNAAAQTHAEVSSLVSFPSILCDIILS